MNKIRFSILLIVILSFACKREEATRWNVDILSPVVKTTLTIDDLVADSILSINSDNSVDLDYSFSFSPIQEEFFLTIPDTAVKLRFGFPFLSAIQLPAGSQFVNDPSEESFDLGDARIEKMTIETGKLQYTITSFVQTKTIYTYTIFKTSNPSGTRFTRTISVPAASSASIPAVKTGTFNFDGYTFDLTGNDGTKFNTFESEVTVNTDPNGGTVSVSNLDSVFIENRLLSLKPAYVEGYIGQSSFIEGPTVNNFSVFDQIISGTLDIDSIDIFTEIKNYVGAEARIKLRQLISNNSRTGNNVPLIHSSINNWITLNRGVDNNGLVSPSINRVFYTKANSNIDRVIENLSDQMTTELEAQVNPLGNIGSGNDFLYFDQVIEADFHIRLPLKFIAKDLKLRQKIDLNLTDDSNPVNNALVTIYAENGFPFDAEIQLFLLNSGGAIIDSVMVQGLIRSANTDALNIVTNPVNSILEAVIPTDKMTIINNNSEVILQIIFNTNNSPHTTIYRDNYIKFKLVTDMNMEIKYN